MEEVWFSMPLSEIDFNNCRSCTPSYRALPNGYPIPACSDRTPEMMPLFTSSLSASSSLASAPQSEGVGGAGGNFHLHTTTAWPRPGQRT